MAESVAAQNNKKEQFQENQADETAAAAAADSREGEGGAAADTQVFFDAENSEHDRSLDDQVHLPSPGLHEHKSEPDTTPAATSANDEAEAHATVVAALRLEISDLTGQVTSLNSKLVNAYGRIGDLEDESDRAEGKAGYLKQRVTTLEQERSQWEERVEGGLLVEKAHVQTELTRMMDRVIEETASRGKAERDKADFESELDDLSANLFNEANRMVAVERRAKLTAEEKSASLEERLRDTETIISQQAKQMGALGSKLEAAEAQLADAKARQGDQEPKSAALAVGEAPQASSVDGGHGRDDAANGLSMPPSPIAALSKRRPSSNEPFSISHPLPHLQLDLLPFHEYHLFLRQVSRRTLSTSTRAVSPGGPSTTSSPSTPGPLGPEPSPLIHHMSHPFIKRCTEEDSDPVLRLDYAPGLNWLSRRQVASAIAEGQLIIEPLFGHLPSAHCALCGTGLEGQPHSISGSTMNMNGAEGSGAAGAAATISAAARPTASAMRKLIDKSWGFRSVGATHSREASMSPPQSPHQQSPTSAPAPSSSATSGVYIFRTDVPGSNNSARYPLCTKYCLPRMRAACEFWGLLRSITVKGQARAAAQHTISAMPKPTVGEQQQPSVPTGPASSQPTTPGTGPAPESVPLPAGSDETPKKEAPPPSATESPAATPSPGAKPPLPKRSEARLAAANKIKSSSTDSFTSTSAVTPQNSSPGTSNQNLAVYPDAPSTPAQSEPSQKQQQSGAKEDSPGNWEEETWRELTKLKEKLFWIRVGADLPMTE